MTELEPILSRLGLTQYLDSFLGEGFDSWEIILDITESDLDALGVKLGHRRKLQREIFRTRGISHDQDLKSASDCTENPHHAGIAPGDAPPLEETTTVNGRGKRKYRRHPKADENAPDRPPSAYVLFSNKIREDLSAQSLSFTEIAKLVGENWQVLSRSEKEPFETQAAALKAQYNEQITEYKQTESYHQHTKYLAEFKTKQNANQNTVDGKRAKLGKEISVGSSKSPTSSVASLQDNSSSYTSITRSGIHRGQYPKLSEQPSPTGAGADMQPGGHVGIQMLSLVPNSSTSSDASISGLNRTISPSGSHALRPSDDGRNSTRSSNPQDANRRPTSKHERTISNGRGPCNAPETVVHRSGNILEHCTPPARQGTSDSSFASDPSSDSNNSSGFQPLTPADDILKLRSLPLPPNLPYKNSIGVQYGQTHIPQPVQPPITDRQYSTPYFGLAVSQGSRELCEPSTSPRVSDHLLPETRALGDRSFPGASTPHEQNDLRNCPRNTGLVASLIEGADSRQAREPVDNKPRPVSPLSVLAQAAKAAYEPP